MTKTQIEKHGEVIKWFIDNQNKGVWYIMQGREYWQISLEPNFYEDYTYVQNDEYAEFRKALADGKTIQYYVDSFVGWQDTKTFDNTFDLPNSYRIKPDSPNLKKGDWFTVNSLAHVASGVYQVDEEIEIRQDYLLIKKGNHILEWNEITKWEPQENELCLFWDNGQEEYFIGKYGARIMVYASVELARVRKYVESDWDNIAPLEFIEVLKK